MSRTDKTKPLHVKLAHGDLAWQEVHDHTDGPCDLPRPRDLDSYGWTSSSGRRCYRTFVYTGTHICCCSLCHGDGGWDLRPGKRQRIESKRVVRDWEDESGHWCGRPACQECLDTYLAYEYENDDVVENRLLMAQPEAVQYLGVSKL
ncbi:hypothetical protein BI081_gp189 [Mycobacterium phage Tonenili]|uniref:Uncharacterized protein n=1 Tax=Mycobacterium phage Tonenili TaxID=1891703 RepID=A0A1C9EHE1_9CAUD|nr:hypothetical protein BI081_gp189 [Mycobacterium phage Tonenili]AON96918.1 hypothetical protein SEA_TONENILI_174 [Mycobacterium phage Tonenili]